MQPGQFLERAVVVQSGAVALDGLFHRGARAPACVIAAPHPALGGSMAVPAINELAWALTRAGHPTLRFDYRGVGASQGRSRHLASLETLPPRITPAGIAEEVEDLLAAADQLRASVRLEGEGALGARPVCAIGYSFGACVALAARSDPRVERLVLVAPPTRLGELEAIAQVQKPLLVVCAQHDGLADREELRRWLEPLGGRAKLEVIAHADHAFRRGLPELGRTVASWLRGGAPLPPPARAEAEGDEEPFVELELEEGPPLDLDE